MDEDPLQESEIPVLYPQSGKAHTHHTLLACWLLQAVLPYIQHFTKLPQNTRLLGVAPPNSEPHFHHFLYTNESTSVNWTPLYSVSNFFTSFSLTLSCCSILWFYYTPVRWFFLWPSSSLTAQNVNCWFTFWAQKPSPPTGKNKNSDFYADCFFGSSWFVFPQVK